MENTRLSLAAWERATGVRFCRQHSGKMKGMYSLSTYKGKNKYCEAYSNLDEDEYICPHCYVATLALVYGEAFVDKYIKNTEILNSKILEFDLSLDKIKKTQYFRLEAFGDVQSVTQVINYFKICYANPRQHFAMWTKNPWVISWAIRERGYAKPENLKIGLSNPRLNAIDEEQELLEKYDFVDFVFTVFTEDFIEEHDVEINCGAKNCHSCLICYEDSGVKYVHEKLK